MEMRQQCLMLLFPWFTLVFFISGLFINFLQLCVLPLYWLKKDWYHLVIPGLSYFIYSRVPIVLLSALFSEITVLGEWWGGFDLKVYVDNEEDLKSVANESSIIVSNHYGDIDWLAAWVFSERVGIIDRAKIISKDVAKYVPVIGWSWWFGEFGFLKRNWQADKLSFMKFIKGMKNNNNSFMMVIMCEGTRRTEAKLKASQEYSRKNNIEPLKHHLLPRPKGFSVIVEALHDKVPAIYDMEIAFRDMKIANLKHIINRGCVEVAIRFTRIPMESVPSTYADLTTYILEQYRKKDTFYEEFVRTGKFPGKCVTLPRRNFNMVLFSVVNILVGIAMFLLTSYCLQTYGVTVVAIFLLLIIIVLYTYVVLVQRWTQTERGSTFGLKLKEN